MGLFHPPKGVCNARDLNSRWHWSGLFGSHVSVFPSSKPGQRMEMNAGSRGAGLRSGWDEVTALPLTQASVIHKLLAQQIYLLGASL